MNAIDKKAAGIKLVVFDVDGVLTDGSLILGENGNEYKIFHVRDGQGLVMLRDSGCKVAVITARSSRIVAERMQSLGIEYVFQGQSDKGKTMDDLLAKTGIGQTQAAYVGDDFLDLPAMKKAGLAIAVADAHPAVREQADWVTTAPGGRGAAREVCELIMQSQSTLQPVILSYLDD
ncbi:MAG: HAD-IIIA family hydrolase [Gammaproteobacteria bacterium]|nr:HAD-IIIA family hydrolase [Gammaproteobacteria bacterium]